MEQKLVKLLSRSRPIRRVAIDEALGREGLPHNDEALSAQRCAAIEKYHAYIEENALLLSARARFERALVPQSDHFSIEGYCAVCRRDSSFAVDFLYAEGGPGNASVPNWRERLICRHCRLPNRQRAMIDFLDSTIILKENATLYVTEETTPFFRALKCRYPKAIGSELLRDGTQEGSVGRHGIRNENLTRLSFSEGSLDGICTAEVLEHVPDYRKALLECHRCLKPGCPIIISVPFILESRETLVRARVAADGTVEHMLPPEYHGDPLDKQGVLCYYHFGWDLLNSLGQAGFSNPGLYFYWSARRGYLGGLQFLICATKCCPSASSG